MDTPPSTEALQPFPPLAFGRQGGQPPTGSSDAKALNGYSFVLKVVLYYGSTLRDSVAFHLPQGMGSSRTLSVF
jgi:hypothetical protein